MKRIVTYIIFLLTSLGMAWADEVSFQVTAPREVPAGETFNVSYSVNQRASEISAPDFTGFDLVAGPYQSTSSSTQWINGQRSSSFNITFRYTLCARKEGTYTIEPATVTVEGKKYRSKGLTIQVLPPDPDAAPQQSANTSRPQRRQQQEANVPTKGDIFMKTVVNKTRIHEQECVRLSYKVYWKGVDLLQFTSNTKLPDFKGFVHNDLEQGTAQQDIETINGQTYSVATIYQTLLFPQSTGDIHIDPAYFEVVLRVPNNRDFFDPFSQFLESFSHARKQLSAPGTNIHVDALPAGKPASFSGGVGSFSISSTCTSQDIVTNDAITLNVTIKGTGNFKLIRTPQVEWPEGFEAYDPKVSTDFKNTPAGVTGSKQIEYLAFAREAGDYTIPPIEFSYFDSQSGQYKTIRTEAYEVHVAPGAGEATSVVTPQHFTSKEDIEQLGTDIQYIHLEPYRVASNGLLGDFSSRGWWLWFVCPLLLAILLFIIFRKQIRENSDLAHVRYKKANKVAKKRLKKAKKLLTNNDAAAFYEEIERAAWQYLSDRLSIPTAELTKENIAGILAQKGVSEQLIQQTTTVLSNAEFARYAPSAAGSKEELFDATSDLINHLEEMKI